MTGLSAPEIIIRPVISEKSIDVSTLNDRNAKAGNKYTFAVHEKANKIQIKEAIEELYAKEKITVVAVNVLTTKAKIKRRSVGRRGTRVTGFTTPWRKAVVTLAPGQKIEFFEGV
jgi:large subunit ribosomal protein L23